MNTKQDIELDDAIPDYVQGRASNELKQRIEARAKIDPVFAEQLALEQMLKASVEKDKSKPLAASGFAKLQARIDAENEQARAVRSRLPLRAVAAAALVVCFVGGLAISTQFGTQPDDSYRTLTDGSSERVPQLLRIIYADQVSSQQILELEKRHGLTPYLKKGALDSHLYQVSTPEQVDLLMQTLGNHELIAFVSKTAAEQ